MFDQNDLLPYKFQPIPDDCFVCRIVGSTQAIVSFPLQISCLYVSMDAKQGLEKSVAVTHSRKLAKTTN